MRCEIADWGLRISKCKIRNGDWPQNFRNSKFAIPNYFPMLYALRPTPSTIPHPRSHISCFIPNKLRTSSQDLNVLHASATFLNFAGIRFRWELLRSAFTALALNWVVALDEGAIKGKLPGWRLNNTCIGTRRSQPEQISTLKFRPLRKTVFFDRVRVL